MEFFPDGSLIYYIVSGDRIQKMLLRYRVEGSTIISDQPSAPREERSDFLISADDVLTLTFQGVKCRFIRFPA
jgi:hypothetical protein